MILHQCPHPGCPQLTAGGRCPAHRTDPQRKTTKQRGYADAWPKLRAMVLREEPLCRPCWTGILIPRLDLVQYDNVRKRWEWRDPYGLEMSMGVTAYWSGRAEPAQHVDHIVSMSDGGARLERENLQPICERCHGRKTRLESEKFPL